MNYCIAEPNTPIRMDAFLLSQMLRIAHSHSMDAALFHYLFCLPYHRIVIAFPTICVYFGSSPGPRRPIGGENKIFGCRFSLHTIL